MPLLHDRLGAEFFGLIGIYVLLTNILSILDLGLISTVSRECAIHRNNERTSSNLIQIISGAEKIMFAVAALSLTVFVLMSGTIASKWMKLTVIQTGTAVECFNLIIISIIIRWLTGLYRGVINGFEWQRATSIINVLTATLRFPVSYLLVVSISSPEKFYFQLQLIIAIAEYALFYFLSKRATASIEKKIISKAERRVLLKSTFSFSLSVAFLAVLTTLFTQIDKMVLSKTLTLGEFGDFSLIASLAMGVAALVGPIATALIPRLSNLNAGHQIDDLFQVYIKSLRLMLVLIVPAGLIVAFFGWQVLYAWTGKASFADRMTDTLVYYVIGNCLWVFAALPGYLKYAKGDIKFLLVYNLSFLFLYMPTVAFIGTSYGAKGVALVWLGINALMLVVAHLLIHREFFEASNRKMIVAEMISAILLATLILFCLSAVLFWPHSRLALSIQIAATALFVATIIYAYLYRHGDRLPA